MSTKNKHSSDHTKIDYSFFVISPTKVAVMTVLTFGFYDVYWFYKQWKAVQKAEGTDIMPFWRGVFSIIFVTPLFERIGFPDNRFAGSYILLSLASRLPRLWWLISFLSFIPLVMAQKSINRDQAQEIQVVYSVKEKLILGIGGLVLLLMVIGIFLPQ